jgi:hypothetical protein
MGFKKFNKVEDSKVVRQPRRTKKAKEPADERTLVEGPTPLRPTPPDKSPI